MRILIAVVSAFVVLVGGSARAQSLEKTYADMCADAAAVKSEACVALAQAVVAKLQSQAPVKDRPNLPTVAHTEPPRIPSVAGAVAVKETMHSLGTPVLDPAELKRRWGLYLTMIEQEWIALPEPYYTTTYDWKVPGEQLVTKAITYDGGVLHEFTYRWDPSLQRLVGGSGRPQILVQPDGSLSIEFEDYRFIRHQLADGTIEELPEKKKGDRWVRDRGNDRRLHVHATPERVAKESKAFDSRSADARQFIERYQRRQEEKKMNNGSGGALLGAVLHGLAQGMGSVEGATQIDNGGYAEAQANLDATVANIQYTADAERHQQALAEQQAKGRAAEDMRQQLAENARWVAEKEQAAAEYRSAQVEAAAARDEARVLAANAEAAAERARRAEAQRQQAAADAKGSVVDQKPPASTGTGLLGGPRESGRGGSTCNEELACRKTCAGDVVAVRECVKQCARESACRVSIQ